MGMLNQAFCTIETNHLSKANNANNVVKDGKTYTYAAREIITCRHHTSFVAYCHPEYNNEWKRLLKEELKVSPTTLPHPQKGIQYGDRHQSLYVIVYDVGTVFLQGNMAVQYSLENIDRMISSLKKPERMKMNKRSKAFKDAIKIFNNRAFEAQDVGTPQINFLAMETSSEINHLIQRTKDPNIGSVANSEPVTPRRPHHNEKAHDDISNISSTESAGTTLQSTNIEVSKETGSALQFIDNHHIMQTLKDTLKKMYAMELKLQNMELEHTKFKEETEQSIKSLRKENLELKQSLGPKISH